MQKLVLAVASASLLAACTGGVTPPDASTGQSSVFVPASSSVAAVSSSAAQAISSEAASSSVVSSVPVVVSSSSATSSVANLKTIYALNIGADVTTTVDGIQYEPEGVYVPTLSGGANDVNVVTNPIAGTTDDTLYQSQRYGLYTYNLPVTAGTYNLTLHFAEHYADMPGVRIISVTAENKVVLDNVDLFDTYNGQYQAIQVSLDDIEVSDGSLTIEFTAAANLATVSGLLVTSVDGARGVFVPPPKPVDPCGDSGNYICLDFEDVDVGSIPDGWGYSGTSPKVVTGKARGGAKSLKSEGSDWGTSGVITHPNVPSKHWGRLFYRMAEPLKTTNALHITLVELGGLTSGNNMRVVDTNLSNSNLSEMKYILNIDPGNNQPEYAISSPTKYSYYSAVTDWVCVEWMVDPGTQKSAVWADGDLAFNEQVTFQGGNQIPQGNFSEVLLGMRTYKGAFNTVWLDDVVIGPDRIGCD